MKMLSLGLSLTVSLSSFANVGVFPKGLLSEMGYRKASSFATQSQSKFPQFFDFHLFTQPQIPAPQLLPWPVQFEDAEHSLGNSMIQFQQYGYADAYWHGGCDLRAQAESEVRTPIGGRIEAGHYGYETNADGSMEKYWTPWPEQGQDMYFEVAVIGDDGLRYEFHHINRKTLPQNIVNLLNQGNARVEAGEIVGRVIRWPVRAGDGTYYHHIHYNVVTPDGTRINPEAISHPIEDRIAPEVQGVYAITQTNQVLDVTRSGRLQGQKVKEFVVAVFDRNDRNVYKHPPTRVELRSGETKLSGWDFRKVLLNEDKSFPNIHQVFLDALTTPSGQRLRTRGDYEQNFFLMRLPMTATQQSSLEILVEDFAGTAQIYKIEL
jgi:hypothetical protein